MSAELQESEQPRDTLQQRYRRMSPAEKRQVIREEGMRLAAHFSEHPEDILADVVDPDVRE